MIYLDTSVVLAHLLAEDRSPPPDLFEKTLVSSRLLEYEVFCRLHALGLGDTHAQLAAESLCRIAFVEMTKEALERARDPFPVPVRTLAAIHLASLFFLRNRGQDAALATYDSRMIRAARAIRLPLVDLP